MLLNVFTELNSDDVAGAQQSAVLDEMTALRDGTQQAV